MAGRFAYWLIGGVAVVGGMALQGDLRFDSDRAEREVARAVDRSVDRAVDRSADRAANRSEERHAVATDAAIERDLSEAVAELVRAEGSLITLRLDDQIPAAVIKQAEQRRDLARQAVDRIADDAGNRDALRQTIRDEVREGVRTAVRSQSPLNPIVPGVDHQSPTVGRGIAFPTAQDDSQRLTASLLIRRST